MSIIPYSLPQATIKPLSSSCHLWLWGTQKAPPQLRLTLTFSFLERKSTLFCYITLPFHNWIHLGVFQVCCF
ncbi:hypothetical protein Peur_027298 [Populus x canadensis]